MSNIKSWIPLIAVIAVLILYALANVIFIRTLCIGDTISVSQILPYQNVLIVVTVNEDVFTVHPKMITLESGHITMCSELVERRVVSGIDKVVYIGSKIEI